MGNKQSTSEVRHDFPPIIESTTFAQILTKLNLSQQLNASDQKKIFSSYDTQKMIDQADVQAWYDTTGNYMAQVLLLIERCNIKQQSKICKAVHSDQFLTFVNWHIINKTKTVSQLIYVYSKITPLRTLVFFMKDTRMGTSAIQNFDLLLNVFIGRYSYMDEEVEKVDATAMTDLEDIIFNMRTGGRVSEYDTSIPNFKDYYAYQQATLQQMLVGVFSKRLEKQKCHVQLALLKTIIAAFSRPLLKNGTQKYRERDDKHAWFVVRITLLVPNFYTVMSQYLTIIQLDPINSVKNNNKRYFHYAALLLRQIFMLDRFLDERNPLRDHAKQKIMKTNFVDICIRYFLKNIDKDNAVISTFLSAINRLNNDFNSRDYRLYVFRKYGENQGLLRFIPWVRKMSVQKYVKGLICQLADQAVFDGKEQVKEPANSEKKETPMKNFKRLPAILNLNNEEIFETIRKNAKKIMQVGATKKKQAKKNQDHQ